MPWSEGIVIWRAAARVGRLVQLVALVAPAATVSASEPISTPANPAYSGKVSSADVLSVADPVLPFSAQRWNLLCAGTGSPLSSQKLPAAPLVKKLGTGGSYTAFQIAEVPEAPNGRVFRFAVHVLDTDARSKHRCEISHTVGPGGSAALPAGKVFWHALSWRARDWPRFEDEQIVAQWLPLTGTAQNPIMALKLVRGRVELQVRTNNTPGAPRDRNEARTIWRQDDFDANRWHDFVFQARISPDANESPFIQLWLDGVKVVEHRAPIGYVGPARVVAKFGLYRYVQTRQGGAWPAGVEMRQMDFGRSVVVADAQGRYDVRDLRAELGR